MLFINWMFASKQNPQHLCCRKCILWQPYLLVEVKCWKQYSVSTFQMSTKMVRNWKLFIGKLDIFPLMCATDKFWITELTLIHKNIRSVRNLHAQELTDIENYLSVWCQTHFDVTNKNNNSSFEGLDRYYH